MNDNDTIKLDKNNIPEHIAIIMDGNGRWAKKRHLPRIAGHKQGMKNIENIASAAGHLGVKVVTLFAFSTENWKRPSKEVNYIMKLPQTFFKSFVPKLIKDNVRIQAMGYLDDLPYATYKAINKAIQDTKNCDGMILNFAVNYGSQDEIVSATKKIANEVENNEIDVEDIDKKYFAQHLMTSSLGQFANPDLLIRTSGEERVSNFLLWQLAYSEFIFDKTYWPDFDKKSLIHTIYEYQQRHRRFGGLK